MYIGFQHKACIYNCTLKDFAFYDTFSFLQALKGRWESDCTNIVFVCTLCAKILAYSIVNYVLIFLSIAKKVFKCHKQCKCANRIPLTCRWKSLHHINFIISRNYQEFKLHNFSPFLWMFCSHWMLPRHDEYQIEFSLGILDL